MPHFLLQVDNLDKRFGGITAVRNYSLRLKGNELVGLIGPNGAGKTTVFNLLSGILRPSAGTIIFSGKNITRATPDQTARAGISRTFQNIRLFRELSVLDNIKVACHMRHGAGLLTTLFHLPAFQKSEGQITDRATELAIMMGLEKHLNEPAQNLPYGAQRRMEIARALAAEPHLLLLDEPAAGMNPNETGELMDIIQTIHGQGKLSILIVEHDMRMVMNLCQRIQVLNQGQLLDEGTPSHIRQSSRVIKAYLGGRKEN